MVAGFKLELVKAIFKFTKCCGGERFIRVVIDALRVARRLRIKKAQEKRRINVVVRADRTLVGVDLAEQHRLDESPGGNHGMKILHRSPEFEGLQHVTFDIDVPNQIRIADPTLVDTAERTQPCAIVDRYPKAGRA